MHVRPRRPSVCRRVCPSGGAAKVCSSFPSSSALFRKRRTATIGHLLHSVMNDGGRTNALEIAFMIFILTLSMQIHDSAQFLF